MTDSPIVHKAEKNWKARVFPLPEPWHGALIKIPGFPLKASLQAGLRARLWQVVQSIRSAKSPGISVWLLMDSLHKDGAVHALSRHGQTWLPDFGLGLWPDREPPRMYQDSDFLDLEFGAELPKMMHSVVRISGDENAAQHAWETMFGTGSTILTLSQASTDTLLDEMRQPAIEKIQDESFLSFPWYFTLVGKKFATEADSTQFDHWLGRTELYMRESEEDDGILILCRDDLSQALDAAGFPLTLPE